MRLTILIDNEPSLDNAQLKSEHGFSTYIEYAGKHILCDTGNSEMFAQNAHSLNIDIYNLLFTFISHAHHDHSGGISALIDKSTYPIYISEKAVNSQFISFRHMPKRDISMDTTIYNKNKEKFFLFNDSFSISNEIAVISCNNHTYATPFGNKYLYINDSKGLRLDNFEHESSLVFTTNKGLVIIAPCSHCGVANIIASAMKFTNSNKVYAYVGGFHFVDSDYTAAEVTQLIHDIKSLAPDIRLFTGHCTSQKAKQLLSDKLDIQFFNTGTAIEL